MTGAVSDRLAALVIIAGSILYLLEARTFRPFLQTEPLGPATFPYIVGGMTLALGSLLLFSTFRQPRDLKQPRSAAGNAVPLALWLLLAAYAVTFDRLGFPLSTALFLVFSLRLLGVRPWWKAVLLGVLFTAAGWYGFRALGVRLPSGEIFRR